METKQVRHDETGEIYLVQRTGDGVGSWTYSVRGREPEGLWAFRRTAPAGWYRRSYMRSGCGHSFFIAFTQDKPAMADEDIWLKGAKTKDMFLCFGPAEFHEANPIEWKIELFSTNGEPVEVARVGSTTASICHLEGGGFLVSVTDDRVQWNDGEFLTGQFPTHAQAKFVCERELDA